MKYSILLAFLAITAVYAGDEDYDDVILVQEDCDKYNGGGCCYNNVIYDRGDSWPSDKYCLRVTCYGKNHTIVTGCKRLPDDGCTSGYKYDLQYPDCCPVRVCEIVKVKDLQKEENVGDVRQG